MVVVRCHIMPSAGVGDRSFIVLRRLSLLFRTCYFWSLVIGHAFEIVR